MQVVIEIPDAPIEDYQDLYYKIHGMAASEGLFDDKEKSQRALALKVVLDVLAGVVNGTPLPKGHGRLIDERQVVMALIYHDFLKDSVKCGDITKILDMATIIEADTESEDKG